MASDSVIDVDALIAPFSEEMPTGPELDRASPSLDAVVTVRDQAKTSERRLREAALFDDDESSEPIPDPEWDKVIELSVELLQNESKDLRVAAWLTEGLMRENGYAGLRDGLRVCKGLCTEAFWEHIHPAPDEFDGHEMTVAQLGGVTGDASLVPVADIPITASASQEYYSMAHYAMAADLDSIGDPEVRDRKIQAGAVNFDTIENAVRQTPAEFYHNLMEDMQEIIDLLNGISAFLDANCKPNQYDEPTSISVTPLRNKVEETMDVVRSLAKHHLDAPADEEQGEAVSGELIAATAGAAAVQQTVTKMASASVVNRDDALEAMNKIADFFERTEPHSVLSYGIRQLVGYGKMSLPELMQVLINDRSVREDLTRTVGIPNLEE